MQQGTTKIYNSSKLEYNLLISPLWVSISYICLITLFPDQKVLIFTFFVLLLGETHFAATWLFFTIPENRSWISKKTIKLIVVPTSLILIFIFIGIWNLQFAVILTGVASGIHVTRQSIGIAKIYGMGKNTLDTLAIYFFSAVFLVVGAVRFVLKDFLTENLKWNINLEVLGVQLLIMTLSLILVAYLILSKKSIQLKISILTGALIYSPYAFVAESQDAVAIGVGMHWCQYLALTYKIYLDKQFKENPKSVSSKIIFVVIYTCIMTGITSKLGKTFSWDSKIILFPLSLQMYHFYLDAFIWKFSDPEIRFNIGGRLFKKANSSAS
jgi:hypothetical protein